jgi:dolichol-phosphate mannosyltransferase
MTAPLRPLLVAMLPTYNEAGNIEALVREILALDVPAEVRVLVVDDNSPDGTARLVDAMSAAEPRARVLLRTKRRGRGAAGIDGFRAALAMGADYVVEMDADFSHPPRFIPALLAAAMSGADAAVGSRFVPGGSDSDRSLVRRAITWCVRRFIRRRFRTSVRDVSSGFRLFRRGILERVDPDDLISVGPSIVLEILYKMQRLRATIVEVPIAFVDRRAGTTKLSALTLLETLLMAVKFPKFYGPIPPADGGAA